MLGWFFWFLFLVGCCGFGQQEELMASSKTCKNEFIFGKKDPGIFSIYNCYYETFLQVPRNIYSPLWLKLRIGKSSDRCDNNQEIGLGRYARWYGYSIGECP